MSLSQTTLPRIAIPEPSTEIEYNQRTLDHYFHAIESAGGFPVLIPLSADPGGMAKLIGTCAAVLLPGSRADVDPEKYGQRASAACHPKDGLREAADELLLQDAFNLAKPILGICYGAQSLNVWLNGTLIQNLPLGRRIQDAPLGREESAAEIDHRKSEHDVDIELSSALGKILAGVPEARLADAKSGLLRIRVNSSHHQAVCNAGDRVRIVGRSFPDGVVEAIEGKRRRGHSRSGGTEDWDHYVIGVEWHPERSYESGSASGLLFQSFVRAAARWRPRPIQASVVA